MSKKKAQSKSELEINWTMAKIDTLQLHEINPRQIKTLKFRNLIKSIKKFPDMLKIRPIVIDENRKIIGGEKRFLAAKEAGLEEVPIIDVRNFTEAQKKEFMIKDNVSSGDWDREKLFKNFEDESLVQWGLKLADYLKLEKAKEAEFPLVPEFDEKYASVVIVCKTKTELATLKTKYGLNEKKRSYKNQAVGEMQIVFYEDIKWRD